MNDTQSSPQEHLSRQERRELRRAEQKSGQSSSGRRRFLRRLLLWGGGLAVLAFIGWGMSHLAADVKLPTDTTGTLTVPVSDTDHSWGPASASVTLVEYGDYQCPACGAYHPVIKQLLAEPELKDKIRFVFRNFPLAMHKNANLAARAAESGGVEGKFWEMHDKIYEEQQKWSALSDKGARDMFMEYARGLSINTEWFAGDLDSDEVAQKIEDDYQGGLDAGVDSTPTFFVNGTHMPQVSSYDEFKQYIVSHVATP